MKNMHSFFSEFGVLTVTFSKMEAELRILISGIAFKGEAVVASAFMDGSQLSENINILRKVGRQYWETQEKVSSIAKKIEKLKPTRNLFIHGLWEPGNFGEVRGFAKVRDLRTSFEDGAEIKSWTHSQEAKYSKTEFHGISRDVNEIINEMRELMKYLSKHEDLEFGWGGGTGISRPIRGRVHPDA